MTDERPTVVVQGGDDASGMATMIADLLASNIRDFPWRARVAGRARGEVVLTASDRDQSVTVSFRRPDVVVRDGVADDAAVLSGAWEDMAKLCSGQASPVAAVARGRVRVRPGRRLHVLPAASFVLTVPASFYGDTSRRRPRGATTAVTALAVVAVVLVRRRRRRASARIARLGKYDGGDQ